jgi:hypothetical protein
MVTVKSGYLPNFHDWIPCELVDDRFKEMVRKSFGNLEKKRQTMANLYNQIIKQRKNFPNDLRASSH